MSKFKLNLRVRNYVRDELWNPVAGQIDAILAPIDDAIGASFIGKSRLLFWPPGSGVYVITGLDTDPHPFYQLSHSIVELFWDGRNVEIGPEQQSPCIYKSLWHKEL